MVDNFNKEFVNGLRFEEISNYVWNLDRKDNIPLTANGTQIIFCKTEYIDELFNILKNCSYDVILITHCADHDINESIFNKRAPNIKKWFAQNVNYKHDDLIPLPLGIENHTGRNKGSSTDFNFMFNNVKPLPISNKIINKLYCNFSLNTHSNRRNVANILYNQGHFIDIKRPFADYASKMQEFLFVASPRGNGIDCHRTWEALYFGCIPIVERHFMYDSYNLPIIQIDNWENIDSSLLNKYILSYKNNDLFKNLEQLKISWWFEKIRSYK